MEKEKKEKVIVFRISEDLFNRLEKYCKRFRIKKSKVITTLLNQFLILKIGRAHV